MTWSLRRRLSAAAVIAAALLLLGVGLVALTEGWHRSNVERTRDLEFVPDRVERTTSAAQIATGTLASVDEDEFVAVFDDAGSLVAATANIDRDELEAYANDDLGITEIAATDIYFDTFDATGDGEWDVVATGCEDTELCRSMIIGRRPADWTTYVVDRLPESLLLMLSVCAVVGVGAHWLVGRSLRPVERMRRELEQITEQQPDRRIDVPSSRDELASLATSLNAAVDRLSAALDAQRRFVSDSAHELRSPLTGLRATLELAERDPSRASQAIAEAIGQVDRTTAVIGDLLELARRDAGIAVVRRSTDIDDLLRVELRELAIRWPDLRIERGSITAVQVRADPGGVARLIRNLLDNAAAHGADAVRASLSVDATAWTLSVDDDGPGIPAGQRERVFERFHRLDESRSRNSGGSGLGLAIVAGIAAAHQGSVRVEQSDLHGVGGARFVVTIPLVP